MKKLILLSLIIVSCHKGNEPAPTASTITPAVITNHKLLIRDNTNLTTNLYINEILQNSIQDTVTVKSGDVIQVVNVGVDTWVGTTKTDAYVSVQVLLDGKDIFDANCTCDVRFNKVIR